MAPLLKHTNVHNTFVWTSTFHLILVGSIWGRLALWLEVKSSTATFAVDSSTPANAVIERAEWVYHVAAMSIALYAEVITWEQRIYEITSLGVSGLVVIHTPYFDTARVAFTTDHATHWRGYHEQVTANFKFYRLIFLLSLPTPYYKLHI